MVSICGIFGGGTVGMEKEGMEKGGREKLRVLVILGFEGGVMPAQRGPSVSIFPKKMGFCLFMFYVFVFFFVTTKLS